MDFVLIVSFTTDKFFINRKIKPVAVLSSSYLLMIRLIMGWDRVIIIFC